MFTKKKKVGSIQRTQRVEIGKKVIDWSVVFWTVFLGFVVLGTIGNLLSG